MIAIKIHVFRAFVVILFPLMISCMQPMVISVPVADVRALPKKFQNTKAPALSHDIEGQISQLVYGEPIRAQRDSKYPGWLIVEILGHMHRVGEKWSNLRGYIQDYQAIYLESNPVLVVTKPWIAVYSDTKKSRVLIHIPFGSRLVGKKHSKQWYEVTLYDGRKGFVEHNFLYYVTNNLKRKWEDIGALLASRAQLFVGCPYVWGGRSPHNGLLADQITGYDCSALIHAVYQSYGLRIPRNSHNQFLYAKSLDTGSELQPGDCLFFGRRGLLGFHMRHVMMYLGNNKFLDSTGLGYRSAQQAPDQKQLVTRMISGEEATGVSLKELKNKMLCLQGVRKHDTVFLGTYRTMLQKLRSDFLDN